MSGDDEIDFKPPDTTCYEADVAMRSTDRRQLMESTGIDLRRPPPPPTPEHAEAVERIRERKRVELLQLRKIVGELLERRGEVSAPEVRVAFVARFRSAALREQRLDVTEKQRIMQMIRHLLLELVRAGEIRLKEVRLVDESPSRPRLLRNYYERVRAPGRAEGSG